MDFFEPAGDPLSASAREQGRMRDSIAGGNGRPPGRRPFRSGAAIARDRRFHFRYRNLSAESNPPIS